MACCEETSAAAHSATSRDHRDVRHRPRVAAQDRARVGETALAVQLDDRVLQVAEPCEAVGGAVGRCQPSVQLQRPRVLADPFRAAGRPLDVPAELLHARSPRSSARSARAGAPRGPTARTPGPGRGRRHLAAAARRSTASSVRPAARSTSIISRSMPRSPRRVIRLSVSWRIWRLSRSLSGVSALPRARVRCSRSCSSRSCRIRSWAASRGRPAAPSESAASSSLPARRKLAAARALSPASRQASAARRQSPSASNSRARVWWS